MTGKKEKKSEMKRADRRSSINILVLGDGELLRRFVLFSGRSQSRAVRYSRCKAAALGSAARVQLWSIHGLTLSAASARVLYSIQRPSASPLSFPLLYRATSPKTFRAL